MRRLACRLASPRLRLAALGGTLAAGVLLVVLLGIPSPTDIRTAVDGAGLAAPLVFVALYALLTILLIPGAPASLAAGALFGLAAGTALVAVGATLGATGAFLVARRLGRPEVERIVGRRSVRIDRWLERNGFLVVLYARLVPVVPFNVLNYVAGASALSVRDYVLATAVGILPGTFAYVALGGSLDEPGSPQFLIAVGLVLALALVGPLLARWRQPPGDPGSKGCGSRGQVSASRDSSTESMRFSAVATPVSNREMADRPHDDGTGLEGVEDR